MMTSPPVPLVVDTCQLSVSVLLQGGEAVLINKFTLLQRDQAVIVRGDGGYKSVTDTGGTQP